MDPIHVTKTFLPPFEEYCELLRPIWDTHLVTNDGPLYQQFEKNLCAYTKVEHVACVGNGTLALQIALRVLGMNGGDVITTPFTHVATSDCLVWEGCRPVYVDIDPDTLNMDPEKIEEKITRRTAGIIPVHVYSNPCNIDRIEAIAERNHLPVIYDAAHAFGAEYKGRSVFSYGDLSMASFNATKGMHTIEGGALFARGADMIRRIRRFGYYGMDEHKQIVQQWGTNAKMIEFCAAMGIVNLRYFDKGVERKKNLYELYVRELQGSEGVRFQKLTGKINYSYMPIVLPTETCKAAVVRALNEQHVFPREYFYPSLETVFSHRITCRIAYDISHRVLCLPMSDYLTPDDVKRICTIVSEAVNKSSTAANAAVH